MPTAAMLYIFATYVRFEVVAVTDLLTRRKCEISKVNILAVRRATGISFALIDPMQVDQRCSAPV